MRSRTQVLIAFFSALIVTLVAVSDMGRTSPGGLSAVHQRVPDLTGRNDCSECHGGIFGTLQEACLACHAPIQTQLEDETGLHGTLGARAEQCGLCHAEHHGAAAPIVHAQSFALAGVHDRAAFDHALIGFVLDGAHVGLDCRECHLHADVPVLPEGAQRFLGLARECASCHEDAHEGAMQLECASCHGQERWDGLASLGHERWLPLVGGHGDLACSACHAEGEPHALDLLGRRASRPEPRQCVVCHRSPHSAGFAQGSASLAALPAGQACVTCHVPEHTSFREPDLQALSAEQHAASGFPLDAPHDAVACAACHAPERKRFDRRYPGRRLEQCSACHEDVHGGQFAEGPFAGQECTACHDPRHFEPHLFDAEEHARAALELSGKHLELECQACHTQPEAVAGSAAAPRVFRGTPATCDACHADAHQGFFEPFLEDAVLPPHGQCEQCHDATSFAAAATGFEHGTFTGFDVLGAHAEAECTLCHAARAEPDQAGRSFGRIEERFGRFEGCVTCHRDPHGERFDPSYGFPATVEGRADCARCHVESSWRSLPRGFDHGYWTGFALSGAHGAASCADCHEPLEGRSSLGRTAGEALGSECAACHDDPHAGQFADEFGSTGCARCHAPEPEDFLSFDHELDARFALGEAHRSLACDACHHSTQRDGLSFVHFRPLGTECTDCHGSSAGVQLRRQPRKK